MLAVFELLGLAAPALAGWLGSREGSWVVVEAWRHGLRDERTTRVSTTLLRVENGQPWFLHQDARGRRWEDADPGVGGIPVESAPDSGRDVLLTTQDVAIEGVPVRCRVILRETPLAASLSQPGLTRTARIKRWEPIDPAFYPRVLKRMDQGLRTRYPDGRISTAAGTFLEQVTALHQRVRVQGRDYDCWVSVRKSLLPDGTFADRTTTWHHEAPPTGWVRRMVERRDPRNGAMSREEQRLVDYRQR